MTNGGWTMIAMQQSNDDNVWAYNSGIWTVKQNQKFTFLILWMSFLLLIFNFIFCVLERHAAERQHRRPHAQHPLQEHVLGNPSVRSDSLFLDQVRGLYKICVMICLFYFVLFFFNGLLNSFQHTVWTWPTRWHCRCLGRMRLLSLESKGLVLKFYWEIEFSVLTFLFYFLRRPQSAAQLSSQSLVWMPAISPLRLVWKANSL